MRAFIVRPFGRKGDIDFDRVEEELLGPALDKLGITGRTTADVVRQGNIRSDMFLKLLAADLVIADVSIHNANVFYELGIRHALRDRSSFLIKSEGGSVPFDLLTDRYFYYDSKDPAKHKDELVAALRATISSLVRDSPVFQQLPNLEKPRLESLRMVPFDFKEEVERAERRASKGVLQLLAEEAAEFDWAVEGWRVVGNAQFELGDNLGARQTWERVQEITPMDPEANNSLATVYERLGELDRSDQLLLRIIRNGELDAAQLTKAKALLGRNAKTRWIEDWANLDDLERRRQAALRSPHLESSVRGYVEATEVDRNDVFAVLNAVTQIVVLTELASSMPDLWAERFEDPSEAPIRLRALMQLREDLSTAARLAIRSEEKRTLRIDGDPSWARISEARLALLTSDRPARVAYQYGAALSGASKYARESSREQIQHLLLLGVEIENAQAALAEIDRSREPQTDKNVRVILFTGHRIDADDRQSPRFPAASETIARGLIFDAVKAERDQAKGKRILAISGASSGGDILFQEVCKELKIEASIYLARPQFDYARESVQDAGEKWVERFRILCDGVDSKVLSEIDELPRWLREKSEYSVHERSTHWILHCARSLADSVSLIALWDGKEPDGRGGTFDIIQLATARGFKHVHLDATKLVESHSGGSATLRAAPRKTPRRGRPDPDGIPTTPRPTTPRPTTPGS
jgi:tetratricopeptide (TPR) repeat protein